MITTRYRTKLPRGLSYPIGAEAISEALTGSPHFDSLSVAFLSTQGCSGVEFRRRLSDRRPYNLLEVTYLPSRKPGLGGANFMVQDGWYDEKWQIYVYPVLSELRFESNRLMRKQGLPAVALWLKASCRADWSMVGRSIELTFSPADLSLVANESHGA